MALVLGALGLGFTLGRAAPGPAAAPLWQFIVDQAHDDPVDSAAPDGAGAGGDPREVIPITPGDGQQPGAAPQGQPRRDQGECTVLMFRDGQFYRMQPGSPGPGGASPGSDTELFPVQPLPAPAAPPFSGPEMRS
ncbi:hypothetical protein HNQ07_002290 [Deinococcus metalli]|uniref:Uncharacterized protein n=1 Tax=Deinococcus metalli TaxID=1141878 RepID=A0A7W8KEU7_9DEIO|nr:hypothetical protein [Deinococcus metalli]MBB5376826.1 hypothetical protein [Deinococcus metalli]GHF45644.1 hypothetical protein GCM10017781_22550 [Deinococcus metalli]